MANTVALSFSGFFCILVPPSIALRKFDSTNSVPFHSYGPEYQASTLLAHCVTQNYKETTRKIIKPFAKLRKREIPLRGLPSNNQ